MCRLNMFYFPLTKASLQSPDWGPQQVIAEVMTLRRAKGLQRQVSSSYLKGYRSGIVQSHCTQAFVTTHMKGWQSHMP